MDGNFGEFVKGRYEALGLASMEQLADLVGVSRNTLYRWISRDSNIKVDNILRLARALQVHPLVILRKLTNEVISSSENAKPLIRMDDFGFIDESIPDNITVNANATFEKTWMIQNIGTVTWNNRSFVCQDDVEQLYVLKDKEYIPFHSCAIIPADRTITIPTLAPGETTELSIKFTTTALPGRAISIWKMMTDAGELCYPHKLGIWCQVIITRF